MAPRRCPVALVITSRFRLFDALAVGAGGLRRYAMRNAVHLLWGLMGAGVLPR